MQKMGGMYEGHWYARITGPRVAAACQQVKTVYSQTEGGALLAARAFIGPAALFQDVNGSRATLPALAAAPPHANSTAPPSNPIQPSSRGSLWDVAEDDWAIRCRLEQMGLRHEVPTAGPGNRTSPTSNESTRRRRRRR